MVIHSGRDKDLLQFSECLVKIPLMHNKTLMLDFLVVCIHEKENLQNTMHESKYINKHKCKK